VSDPIQLVIIDDHPMWREGVVATLQSDHDIHVVGEGATAAEALELCSNLLPEVLLLDLNIPGGGIQAARTVTQACPVTKIIMLTSSEEEDDVLHALKAGARGYVLKGVPGRELKRIVRAVFAGEIYVAPELAALMLQELAAGKHKSQEVTLLDDLTPREREILELVASGKSNKEIGGQLELTEKTVKHYMTNILQKLQVRNRVEAALLAQRISTAEAKG
jgi:two-component system, NarL family, nitrate/nitrite response regulator NarL